VNPEQPSLSFEPNAWVKLDADGTTTITINCAEMGQGVRTSLAMIVAEEMDADWSKVKVRQSRPDLGTYQYASTGGSMSISSNFDQYRTLGAAMRLMLLIAAAKKWGISGGECMLRNGAVLETGGPRAIFYGDLVDDLAKLPIQKGGSYKKTSDYSIIGTRKPHIDNPDIVSGKAIYGLDVRIPGMKYAVMVGMPAFGASIRTFDATDALRVPGVIKAEIVPKVGLVVLADTTYAAISGRDALKIEWDMGTNVSLTSATISDALKAGVGDIPDLPANSATIIEARYELPYLAHATMEPMNCVADVRETSADIWCPTQAGDSARDTVAFAIGIPAKNIIFNTTLLGGGYGRRLVTDYAVHAARISKAFKTPVLFMFTRQDDMRDDYYRRASYHVCKGGLDATGAITGIVEFSVNWSRRDQIPYNSLNYSNSYNIITFPVPYGSWRSVENSAGVFVLESFVDELAASAGKDPYLFRRNLLTGAPRLLAVLDKAAELAEWNKPLPKGWGRGIACSNAFSNVAHVVEVSVSPIGLLKVERIIAVVDCGIAVNPMGVEAQMQGAAVDALSTAIKAEITIEKGGVKQSTFIDYEWLRINEMPKIEVHIMPSTSSPSGMGEAGFPSVSPALCNAIFNATGKRVRSLPIQKTSLSAVDAPVDQMNGDMNIFPSPFTTAFTVSGTIKSPASKDITLTIRNLLGTTLVEVPSTLSDNGEFTQAIEFPRATTGVYFLTVRCGAAQFTRKIIKE